MFELDYLPPRWHELPPESQMRIIDLFEEFDEEIKAASADELRELALFFQLRAVEMWRD